MRKLWNPRNFKAHVSPHEMLQAVVLCSKKTFQITKQGDGVDFLSWFLNALHSALGGTKKKKKTIVNDVFQGSMRIFTKSFLILICQRKRKSSCSIMRSTKRQWWSPRSCT